MFIQPIDAMQNTLCRSPGARPHHQWSRTRRRRGATTTTSGLPHPPPLRAAGGAGPGIQFSADFARLLQESLARQSRTTAERIGVPGLVLDAAPGDGTSSSDNDDGTGAFVWGAGAALASALYGGPLRSEVSGCRVLELGCGGSAVVAIAAAAAGAKRVVATDLPSRLAAAERSVALNRAAGGALAVAGVEVEEAGVVLVRPLDWAEGEAGVRRAVAEDGGGLDVVLGADLTYSEDPAALAALARVVRAALAVAVESAATTSPTPPPVCLLAHRPRSRAVDAAMARAFEGEGLALRRDEPGTAALLAAAAGGGDEDDEGGGGEPLVLFRIDAPDEC